MRMRCQSECCRADPLANRPILHQAWSLLKADVARGRQFFHSMVPTCRALTGIASQAAARATVEAWPKMWYAREL